ncbi:MAG: hypothetical protein ACLP5V_08420 [Candidatus Bathyarchaeia archaeon]
MEAMLIFFARVNYVSVTGLHKSGQVGLLLTLTSFLAIFLVPGAVGVVVGGAGISPQQGLPQVMVTVVDCSGNPVGSAVIQLYSLTTDQWSYTASNGEAILSVFAGTYTIRGGYGTFIFSQTINVGTGGSTVAVSLGAGCNTISSSSIQTSPYTPPYTPGIPIHRSR